MKRIRVFLSLLLCTIFLIAPLSALTVNADSGSTYTPTEHKAKHTPKKYTPTTALYGYNRLLEPVALPLIDTGVTTGYSGSIDKSGGNADWDWDIYRDDNGEWVLFEQYGPGCIYNFTQHRYPTSEEPTFRFYIDDADTPAFEIKQSEFGTKAPFISPLADIYEGPEAGERGPIWVVRSFVPMSFCSYIKVTSSVRLEGCDKANGEGGWGHITYTLFDSAEGIEAFTADMKIGELFGKVYDLACDPKYSKENEKISLSDVTVEKNKPVEILNINGAGAVSAFSITLLDDFASASVLSDLRVKMYWDGESTPSVDAPIGTLFGCEYGNTACDNCLYLLGLEISPNQYLKGYNYFPMPYWKSARIELYTAGETPVTVKSVDIETTPDSVVAYPKESTGYFVSSAYYEKTANVAGENSVIATLDGTGHMVYGVLSGYEIGQSGCEGDVRVFFDGRQSPEIESDGSESWASYGWGFVTPPQSNPFSGYNGSNLNSDWSEVRLTIGDSYFFEDKLIFELEHGGSNDGMGYHSGQIFAYVLSEKASAETDTVDFSDEESLDAHGVTKGEDCSASVVESAYADGINDGNIFAGETHTPGENGITFKVKINPENDGVVLMRTFSQKDGRQAAGIAVDGVDITERIWYYADSNANYEWADDSFRIPASYTSGKSEITVTVTPIDKGNGLTWNISKLRVLSVSLLEKDNSRSGFRLLSFPFNVIAISAVLLIVACVTFTVIKIKRKKSR